MTGEPTPAESISMISLTRIAFPPNDVDFQTAAVERKITLAENGIPFSIYFQLVTVFQFSIREHAAIVVGVCARFAKLEHVIVERHDGRLERNALFTTGHPHAAFISPFGRHDLMDRHHISSQKIAKIHYRFTTAKPNDARNSPSFTRPKSS